MKKKILSLLLTISMLTGMVLPVSVFAEEEATDTALGYTEDNPVVCDTLDELTAALEDESIEYVKLTTLAEGEGRLPGYKGAPDAAIFSNGAKHLTIEGTPTFTGHPLINIKAFIKVNGNLSVGGTGTLTYCHGSSKGLFCAFYMNDPDASLTFREGDYTINSTAVAGDNKISYGRAVYAEAGELYISGGKFYGEVNDYSADVGLTPLYSNWSAVEIVGSTYANISGGEFKTTVAYHNDILGEGLIIGVDTASGGKVVLEGGTFYGIASVDMSVKLNTYLKSLDRGYAVQYKSLYYNDDQSMPFNGDKLWRAPYNPSTGTFSKVTVLDIEDAIGFTFQYPDVPDNGAGTFNVVAGDPVNFRFSSAELPDEFTDRGFYTVKQIVLYDYTIAEKPSTSKTEKTAAPLVLDYTFANHGSAMIGEAISIMHDDYVSYDKNDSPRYSEVYYDSEDLEINVKSAEDYGSPVTALPALTVKPPVVGDLIFGTNEDPDPENPVTWETNWYYENEDGERTLVDLSNETFKAGVLYECEIVFTAKDGFYIPMKSVCNLNGADLNEYAQTGYSITTATYTKYFRPMVDEAHLTVVQPPIVGDPHTVVPVVEGADEYGVTVATRWKKNGNFYVGTIESGVTYSAYIQVSVKGGPGYSFTDDAEVTVNGYTVPEGNFDSNRRKFTYEVEFVATEACTITYYPGEYEGTTEPRASYIGEVITLADNFYTTPDGMQFKAWSIDGALYDEGDSYTVTGDTTITAVWEEKTCYVLYDSTNGDPLLGFTYTEGKPVVLADNIFPAPEGKVFAGWLIGEDIYAEGAEYTFTEDVTVYAVWKDASTPGDVNRDTNINLADVSLMLKYIAKWDVEMDTDAADVTGEGKINLGDVSLMLKYIAKWDVVLK